MKNMRSVVMIGVALLAALLAVWAASRWVSQQGALTTSKVVVAASDIDIGTRLTQGMVSAIEWPSGAVPKGALQEPTDVLDRVVRTSLQKGEPVLESKLAPVGSKGGLSAIVGEGNRAITVKVNEVVGVAGFALPGNYVDIIVNTQEEGTGNNSNKDMSVSKIVLEKILVLAVAQEAGRDETKPKVVSAVTLEVTPEQAEKLDLARSVGTLSLVLRNQVDPKAVQTAGATKATLLGVAGTAPPVVQRTSAAPAKVAATKNAAITKQGPPKQVAMTPRDCVVVITGMDTSRECF